MRRGWERRVRWLGRWWFLTTVALLALNDHVLKARFGNWWTGKLSDLVGPVVVATLIAIPLGRTVGVVAAGLGFAALKTVPGVAELAAPLLGGVTLRDATDLIGLVALLPAWRLMAGTETGTDAPHRTRPRPHLRPSPNRGKRRVLQTVGLIAAVMATTATSDTEPPSVSRLEVFEGTLYASVWSDYDSYENRGASWHVSTDGGLSWEPTRPPWRLRQIPRDQAPAEACRSDGWCFRSTGSEIQERSPSGGWRGSYSLTWDQRRLLSHRTGGSAPRYGPPIIAPVQSGEHVVTSAGSEGVVVLDTEGRWHRRGVGGAGPTDISGTYVFMWLGQWMIFICGLVALVWIPIRAARPSQIRGGTKFMVWVSAMAIGVGFFLTALLSAVLGSFGRDDPTDLGVLLIVLSILVVAAPLGFIRLLGGPVRKGPICISQPLPPPPAPPRPDLPPPPRPDPAPPPLRPPWDPGTGR